MKKILLLLVLAISTTFTSCQKDDCQQEAQVQFISLSRTTQADVTVLSGTGVESDPFIIDLSGMTENIKIDEHGPHGVNAYYQTTGDTNLNGFKLDVHHLQLNITGNLNGGGTLKVKNHTIVCVAGAVQNNPTLDIHNEGIFNPGQDCSSTLSVGGPSYSNGDIALIECEHSVPCVGHLHHNDDNGKAYIFVKVQ